MRRHGSDRRLQGQARTFAPTSTRRCAAATARRYSNDCAAHSAGVSVASKGECDGGNSSGGTSSTGGSTGTAGGGNTASCGGLLPAKCPADQYCNFPPDAQCGAADQTGTCAPKPEACDLIYAPVCGCDGKTYGNACAAASAGVSVAKTGECASGPWQVLRRRASALPCAADEYCNYTPVAMCGRADATGTCTKIPRARCTADLRSGVRLRRQDLRQRLRGGPRRRVGRSRRRVRHDRRHLRRVHRRARARAASSATTRPPWACGDADGTGTCTAIPDACDAVLKPVCGCDGKTYGNDCEANTKGTSVRNQGACE